MVVIEIVIILIIHLIEGPPIQISRLSAILSHRQKLSIFLIKSRLLHFLVEVFEVLELGWFVLSWPWGVCKDQLTKMF